MTLTELRYITAVARERHFGHAATSCHVSQPTLSVAIRKLEEELGVSIFERRPGEIVPTPVGEKIIAQAQQILEEIEGIRLTAQTGKDQLASPLRVGVIYTIAPYLLPSLIPIVHKRAPNMPLLIEENYTGVLMDKVKQGELDAIIISYPFSEPGLVTRPLYDEPFVIATPANHPWAKRKQIKAEQLAEQTVLLLGSGNCFRDQVLAVCPTLGQSHVFDNRMQQTLIGSSLETIRHMVATGAGITVLPCSSTNESGRQGNKLLAFRPFARPIPKRRVALAWRKRFPRPLAIEKMTEAILDTRLVCVEMLDLPAVFPE